MSARPFVRAFAPALAIMLAVPALVPVLAAPAHAATVLVVNADGAGEGFNDPTPVAPEGGNSGTTLGQQRLNVFTAAAQVWGTALVSTQTIKVRAQFNTLSCDATSGTLGSAGATGFIPLTDGVTTRVYPVALAEAIVATDINGADPDPNEIFAQFNSRIDLNDTGCLGTTRWYYGLSGPAPAGTIALYPTVLHEIGHGLGFLTLLCTTAGGCGATPQGGYFGNVPDAWSDFLQDNDLDGFGTDVVFANMTNAQRVFSFTDDPFVTFNSPTLNAQLASFGQGPPETNENKMRMFAPNPFQGGSSLSHFHEAADPNLLMEPIADADVFNQTDLTLALFEDIGWPLSVNDAPTAAAPASIAVTEDAASALTGITFADADAGAATVVATFAVGSGSIAATAGGGVLVGGTATSRTLTGTLAQINARIAGGNVTFTPPANSTANVTLTVTINDNGSVGSGGKKTGTDTATLAVTAVNDAPVITAPAAIAVTEDTLSTLSGVSFADVDAASGSVVATFAVGTGTMNAPSCTGVTSGGTATSRTLTGTLANVNACLSGGNVRYTTAANATTDVTLNLTISDGGNTGSGGALTDTQAVTLDVTAVNDAPVLTVPATRTINDTGATALGGISVSDVDAGSALLDLVLAVTDGTLAATGAGGVTVTGSGTASMTLRGTAANLNAFVAAGSASFVQDASPSSTITLTSTVDDNGNTGTGGTLSDSGTTSLRGSLLFRNGFE